MSIRPLCAASRPAVPGRSGDARPRARALRDGGGPADRQPARPHRSAVVRRRRAVRRRIGAVHHAGPLRVPHALQPGRPRSRTSASRAATAAPVEPDARKIWRTFAAHYHLFRGTPTRIWLDHAFADGVRHRRAADRRIRRPHLRPHQRLPRAPRVPAARAVRALQHRGDRDDRIAARPARASPQDPGSPAGRAAWSPPTGPIRSSTPSSRASATTSRSFGELTGENTATWHGYLAAHRKRRAFFKSMGATSTDHGHPTARTCDLAGGRVPATARPRAGGHGVGRRGGSSSAARC